MRNGLMIVSLPSMSRPCCLSSLYSVLQSALRVVATTKLSQCDSWYFTAISKAFISVFFSIVFNSEFFIILSTLFKCLGLFKLEFFDQHINRFDYHL